MLKISKLSSKYIIPSLNKNTLVSGGVIGKSGYYTGNDNQNNGGGDHYYYSQHQPPPSKYHHGLGGGANTNHQQHSDPYRMKATTILSVRRNGKVVIIGDGQVTLGHSIVKPNAKKIRKLADGKIIAGFAGSVADAFTLFELLERKLTEHRGLLLKSCVELAQQWRTDKYYRRLEASLIVADKDITLNIDGNGDVLEPNDGILAIGSGGDFALSAARALLTVPDLDPEEIAKRSMKIAADICIYTNHNFIMEVINDDSNNTLINDGGTDISNDPSTNLTKNTNVPSVGPTGLGGTTGSTTDESITSTTTSTTSYPSENPSTTKHEDDHSPNFNASKNSNDGGLNLRHRIL